MDFLIIGNGMFGSAIARYLAPHAAVTVVGPGPAADGSRGHGAHYDEGRIIGDAGQDLIWSELNRRARHGLTELDPGLVTPCGALGAQAADAVGQLAASLALADRWESDLPQDAFRHVPADGPWQGLILLRDQVR